MVRVGKLLSHITNPAAANVPNAIGFATYLVHTAVPKKKKNFSSGKHFISSVENTGSGEGKLRFSGIWTNPTPDGIFYKSQYTVLAFIFGHFSSRKWIQTIQCAAYSDPFDVSPNVQYSWTWCCPMLLLNNLAADGCLNCLWSVRHISFSYSDSVISLQTALNLVKSHDLFDNTRARLCHIDIVDHVIVQHSQNRN